MMSKNINTKIEVRKEILEIVRKKYDNICVGDYDSEELEVIQKELKEIAKMVRDKDKYIELMEEYKNKRDKNIDKYFCR